MSESVAAVPVYTPATKTRTPSPEVVEFANLNWTRSDDPAVLDAPPITLTLADPGRTRQLGLIYPSSKIREFSNRIPNATDVRTPTGTLLVGPP